MRYELHKNSVHVDSTLIKAIEHKVDKLKDRLKRYHPEVADLDIKLGHQEKVNEFECNMTLVAFKDTLHAKKSSPELRVAVDKTFDAILKELEQYRSKINKNLNHDQ